MRITFHNGNGPTNHNELSAVAQFVGSTVAIIPADYLRHACGASFDVQIKAVSDRGIEVVRLPATSSDGDNPPFEAAFFGWGDIDEVHVY